MFIDKSHSNFESVYFIKKTHNFYESYYLIILMLVILNDTSI